MASLEVHFFILSVEPPENATNDFNVGEERRGGDEDIKWNGAPFVGKIRLEMVWATDREGRLGLQPGPHRSAMATVQQAQH